LWLHRLTRRDKVLLSFLPFTKDIFMVLNRFSCLCGVAVAALALVLPQLAHAEYHGGMRGHHSRPDPMELDLNKDGMISKQEFVGGMLPKVQQRLENHFAMIDANKDGQLDKDELAAKKPGTGHGKEGGYTAPPPGETTPKPVEE
jgi:EF hand